jgi:hypothetical protein
MLVYIFQCMADTVCIFYIFMPANNWCFTSVLNITSNILLAHPQSRSDFSPRGQCIFLFVAFSLLCSRYGVQVEETQAYAASGTVSQRSASRGKLKFRLFEPKINTSLFPAGSRKYSTVSGSKGQKNC